MDIAALSTALSSMRTASSISMAMLKKTMDTVEENSAIMIQNIRQMELSVNPNLGSNFDMRI